MTNSNSNSNSYISITQKPISIKLKASKTTNSFHYKLPSPHRFSRYFVPFLSIWALLSISQVYFSPLPCPHYLQCLRPDPHTTTNDEFWTWAQSGVTAVKPCLDFTDSYVNESRTPFYKRYMMVVVSGGLNQQRNQIIDAVVIARILRAVLVAPILQVNQIWGDDSEFGDIFDISHFKETLKHDVKVVSSLPATHLTRRRIKAPLMPFNAGEEWVHTNYGEDKLDKKSVLILRGFDSRLAKNLTSDLQKLRCKVAFEALRFQPWIEELAERFVRRMREEGPYVALHLRLEKDVWVRTGCHSGLGSEADEVVERERALKPRLLTSRSKLTPRRRYLAGLCPLNANEISWVLKGLGASRKTRIYWAGGEPFGGRDALQPLRADYAKLFNKWSLARPRELDGFKRKPSILAAIDYQVCLKSQLFVASHGGNMARSLQGHRTYLGYGKPIRPNKRQLVRLFLNTTLTHHEIRRKIKQIHIEPSDSASILLTNKDDVIAYPAHHCMCTQ
ncbi:hypothetical protein LUZ61_004346 [Rhynchospora tenuis]|uniref:O-fucosyltransferase family protein n=1 Tax=Rhynchospora tenuis TaxID=198213 RepID=A0AAD5ZMN7_9POAL|nr:hypothetical protein LUZ61_004346 [Rhynchospora tenuis]